MKTTSETFQDAQKDLIANRGQGNQKRKEREMKTKLYRACRNNYGFVDATPGTDMTSRLAHVSERTIRRYIKSGWLKQVGSGLILTHDGYMSN